MLTIWFITHVVYTSIDGISAGNQVADVGIIFGNTVNPDGSLSNRLQKRVECGVALFKSQRVKILVVSGGLGKEGFWEGDKMRDFLLQHDVPDSAIIVDNFGNNTEATVINVMRQQDSLKFSNIIVVSQFYHLTRIKKLFRKHSFQHVSGAAPNYFEFRDIYSLSREFFAYYLGS